jgi:hypothetical protein
MTPIDEAYFLGMVVGVPLLLLVVALIAGYFHRDGYAELLDWKPTRSPEREIQLELDDIEQMLDAQNRHRRRRGAPERTLDDVHAHVRTSQQTEIGGQPDEWAM